MEEGRVVAFLGQQSGNTGVGVHRRGCQYERFYEARYAAEYARHTVYALLTVAERVLVGAALLYQLVHIGRVALVATALKVFVQGSDVLASEALDDEYHHVFLCERMVGMELLDRIEHLFGLLFRGIIGRNLEHTLAQRAHEGKRRVEHKGAVDGPFHILVGIADGDRAHATLQTTSARAHTQGGRSGKQQEHSGSVSQSLLHGDDAAAVKTRLHIELCHEPYHRYGNQNEVPVLARLPENGLANDTLLVGKLLKHGGGGAAEDVREVDGVGHVDDEAQAVGYHEHPLAHLIIYIVLLQPQWEKHHHDIRNVAVDDGRTVEHPSSGEDLPEV